MKLGLQKIHKQNKTINIQSLPEHTQKLHMNNKPYLKLKITFDLQYDPITEVTSS